MDAEIQKQLREKFDTAQIGLKPKITCKACSDSRGKACDKHPKAKCTSLRGEPGCGQWITPAHMHIEFVGHANVTDRLLSIDPQWTWEPVAFGPDGLPALTKDGGLWIRLTVAGVTRIGYGGADGKTGDDAVKEAVSDAIKTTAMRFGVALDLWRKEEASGKPSEEPAAPAVEPRRSAPQRPAEGQQNGHQGAARPPADESAPQPRDEPAAGANAGAADGARRFLRRKCEQHGYDWSAVAVKFAETYEGDTLDGSLDPNRITAFAKTLERFPEAELKAPAANGAPQ